jgi:hypothetical protein
MSQGFTRGVPIDTDPTLSLDSDLVVPSQKAIKAYVDNQDALLVSNVTATAPLTSTGGTTPVISTSMTTDKLIGRGTAGTGVMEEITLGTGLDLAATTLNVGNIDLATLSVTETAARLDNWTPTGWPGSTADVVKVIALNANYVDKVQVISGLTGGTGGKIVTITNSSTDNLIILEQNSTNSSAANRMRFQGRSAYFLFPNEQITLLHNGTDWGAFSSNPNNGHMAFDDMLGAPNAASPVTYFGETTIGTANGTGAIIRNDNLINGAFGTISFTTGTLANNSGTLKSMGRSGFYTFGGAFSKYCVVSRIKLDQLPTAAQDFIFGVGISANSNATGITTAGSNSWYASFANSFWRNYTSNTGGTLISDTTTSLPVTTNGIVLGTYHPNNLGDTVFFYSADGGMTYAVSSRFVRVSSNYGGAPVIGVNKLVGTTAITATVDYVGISCRGGVI